MLQSLCLFYHYFVFWSPFSDDLAPVNILAYKT
jgi:hypothetical protein